MDLLDVLCGAGSAAAYKNTSNYYYEYHICEKSGENIKVRLDYMLSCDTTDDIIRFGKCAQCGICFYHKDHGTGGL